MWTIALMFITAMHPVNVRPFNVASFDVIDLSHTLDIDSIKWPTSSNFTFTTLTRGWEETYWVEMNKYDTPEHIGTHLDAPSHFSNSTANWKVHEIPPERLVGPGVVIDVRDKVDKNPDYRLQTTDLQYWESLHGNIPNRSIVFMWSAWDTRYPDKTRTFNTATPENTSTFHFPGFHPDAVTWLINNRNVGMIGVDTPSTDYGQSADMEVHQLIGKANVMGLENVNNLGKLPASGSLINVAPVKLLNGSGTPVRILALVEKSGQTLCSRASSGSRVKPFWYH